MTWLIINALIYLIGIAAFSTKSEMLGNVLVTFGSTSLLIYGLKSLFHSNELWVIFFIGGPLLLIMILIARALGNRLSGSNRDFTGRK